MAKKKEDGQEQDKDATKDAGVEYPFLREPAEAGGVIICTDDGEATAPLTPDDVAAANEEMYQTSKMLREEEANKRRLLAEEKQAEDQLKTVRAALRKNEESRLELGSDLATFSEQIHDGVRKIQIKVVHTVTTGNELVITDARDGSVRMRRTATKEEIEWSRNGQQLFASATGATGPDMTPTTVSVVASAYKKAGKNLKASILEVFPENAPEDTEGYTIVWQPPGEDGRSFAIVPRWVASRLRTITEKAPSLDFKIEAAKDEPKPDTNPGMKNLGVEIKYLDDEDEAK